MSRPSEINPSQRSEPRTKRRQSKPLFNVYTLYHLFFTRKFLIHRLMGLTYLIQYVTVVLLYFYDYQKFKNSPLTITLPLSGVLMSVTAALTFTFLPNTNTGHGFFSSKSAASYDGVVENSFYAVLVSWAWLYYNDSLFPFWKRTLIIENSLVFLPFLLRQMWPKTSFRAAFRYLKASDENAVFFYYGIWTTKIFYLWAKHMFFYFLCYIRFLDRMAEEQIYHIHLLLILGCFSFTISVFLHTLKFKGYIDPKTALIPYVISYLVSLYPYFMVSRTFLENWPIIILAAFGIPLNFCRRKVQISYQVLLMLGFNAKRYGLFQTLS